MEDKNFQKKWWSEAIQIFARVTGWIAGPIIIALFLGRYLDNKYHSDPWIFLGLTLLAFLISSFSIVKITINYTKKIEQEAKKATKGKENKNSLQ